MVDVRSADFPASPGSVREARALVAAACREWGLERLSADAQLVVSELVTNALRHARTPVRVSVSRRERGLRVQVSDGSADGPKAGPVHPLSESGRGLPLVSALTTGWFIESAHPGKRVTADL